MPPLDDLDCKIIALLQRDARITNKDLAAQVGLAPSSCLMRVRRLREADVLRGFHAEVNPAAVGIGLQAMVSIRLSHHTRAGVMAFRQKALALPEVISIFYIAGRNDFLLHVVVRNTEHLRVIALDDLSTWPEVDRLETNLIYEQARSPELPIFLRPEDP